MNTTADAAAELARVIADHRDAVLDRWLHAVLNAPPGHYRDYALEEVAAWLDATLCAVERALDTGTAAPLRDHATGIGAARQRLGFNIEEVIEALLRLKDAVADAALAEAPCGSTASRCCLRTLDEVLRVTVSSFSARFAESLREQQRRVSALEERNRLARELHDSVSQSLYALHLQTEAAGRLLARGDTAAAAERVRDASEDSRQALRDMRLLVFELRPSTISDDGLEAALRTRLAAVERRSGIRVELLFQAQLRVIGRAQEEALYGIIREALNNVVKHSAAGRVEVGVAARSDRLVASIRDDGCGFDLGAARPGAGLGLAGMIERAAALGGELHITSAPGAGTEVVVDMPLPATSAAVGEGLPGGP